MSLPLQHTVNMDNPEEHLVWALLSMDTRQGVPMLMPQPILRSWSKHLYDCGFRHHPELQAKYYRPPATDSTFGAVDGQWVTTDTPGVNPIDDRDTDLDRAIDALPPEVVEAIIARHSHTDDDDNPDGESDDDPEGDQR